MRRAPLLTGVMMILAVSSLAAAAERPPLVLRMAGGAFRPEGPLPEPPGWYRDFSHQRSAAGKRYLVAITRGPVTPEQRAELAAAGAELLGYVPRHGYTLRVDPEQEEALRSLGFVAWLGSLPAHHKVQPGLSSEARQPGVVTKLRVILRPDEPEDRVRQALAGFTTQAAASGKGNAWRVEASVPGGALPLVLSSLAGLPEVEAVEKVRPIRSLNQTGT